jgi:hypothetical protein
MTKCSPFVSVMMTCVFQQSKASLTGDAGPGESEVRFGEVSGSSGSEEEEPSTIIVLLTAAASQD